MKTKMALVSLCLGIGVVLYSESEASSKGASPKSTPGEVRDIHIAGSSPDALPGAIPDTTPFSRKATARNAVESSGTTTARPAVTNGVDTSSAPTAP